MRGLRRLVLLLACLAAVPVPAAAQRGEVCGTAVKPLPTEMARHRALQSFARQHRLDAPDAFAGTILALERDGALPECYLTKDKAQARGWRPGDDLWRRARGASIGGDRFGNRERRLPQGQAGGYREADLDFDGGKRGARRLVWAPQSAPLRAWITLDHYDSFILVPPR